MACSEEINNYFQSEANRISAPTYTKGWAATPWDSNEFVPKVEWPDEMGESPNILVYNRALPLNGPITVEAVEFNSTSNSCNPVTATIYQSTTRTPFQLYSGAAESERICIFDARMSWNIANQTENVLRNLQMNTRFFWQNARRDQFTALCANKVVADSSLTPNSASFSTSNNIGQINRQMLDHWNLRLLYDGADLQNTLVVNEFGRPVLPLVLSPEAQQTLVTNDQTINNIRWSSSDNNRLLGPLGSFVQLDGFKMYVDLQAARWNLVNGSWVRVPFYTYPTNPGDPSPVNPAYLTAEYEDLYIPSPQVLQFAIPSAQLNAGPVKFNAQDYMGNFKWLNTPDNLCNKDGNNGYFRGLFAYAPKAGITDYGAVIRFRRCPQNWVVDTTCS